MTGKSNEDSKRVVEFGIESDERSVARYMGIGVPPENELPNDLTLKVEMVRHRYVESGRIQVADPASQESLKSKPNPVPMVAYSLNKDQFRRAFEKAMCNVATVASKEPDTGVAWANARADALKKMADDWKLEAEKVRLELATLGQAMEEYKERLEASRHMAASWRREAEELKASSWRREVEDSRKERSEQAERSESKVIAVVLLESGKVKLMNHTPDTLIMLQRCSRSDGMEPSRDDLRRLREALMGAPDGELNQVVGCGALFAFANL